jgi:tRNA A-37 threonylcarbamoyl transferase component Bud32
MSPGERDRIQVVFGEAMDLPPAERPLYLDRRCGAEGPVREAIDGMLLEHEQRSGILDRPLFFSPPQSQEDVWTGRVLNCRYRIERFVARGGMSAVYLAHDRELAGKRVIVKFLHSWTPQYAWAKTKFRHEMEALARIDHHAVVGVLDTGETADGTPFLVIEYIDGVTLRLEMGRGPMPAERVAGIIRQVARGVAAAHAKGVLHRDLKPENIMLERPGTPEEWARIIDFGIARLEEAEGGLATSTTQFAGTTAYMAPEHLRGKPTPASDVYAMAVVAYEMLAGQRPFLGAGPIEIYEQQRAGSSLKPLRHAGVSESAARLIAKQLAFREEDRSASALVAGEAIADALLHPGGRIWSRRHTTFALAGGGLAALGGGGIWWTRRPAPLADAERVIELPTGSEPLEHGFQSRNTIENRVIPNADATGFDALRLITSDQGAYYHPLNAAQAAAANRHGWKVTFEAAAEEGLTSIAMDLPNAPVRYAVNAISIKGDRDVIRLLTGFTPTIHGIDFALPGPAGARRRYMLELLPGSKTADLWVGGVKLYSGYAGLNEYLYNRGLEIGVARYRSARGVGVFWSLRLEIG